MGTFIDRDKTIDAINGNFIIDDIKDWEDAFHKLRYTMQQRVLDIEPVEFDYEWHTGNPPEPQASVVTRHEYLVTYDSGGMDVATWTNSNRFWSGHVSKWHWQTDVPFAVVVAWRELPCAYKEWKQ